MDGHRPQADLPVLVARLDDATTHLRTALDRPDLPVTLELRATMSLAGLVTRRRSAIGCGA